MNHHPDCDGYLFAHAGIVRREGPTTARGMMRRAACESCEWRGDLVGKDAYDLAERQANMHTREVKCEGECLAWETRT